ncbi:MAG: hypothetical protein HY319_14160 [Armatimonadetes bacterium]|nr:hypothetical protein [Armatimonadota bacterium]
MEEALDRSDVEVIELDGDGNDPYSIEKVLGVAIVGALGSLLVYYLFNQLDADKRDKLKDNVVNVVKGQLRQWGEEP